MHQIKPIAITLAAILAAGCNTTQQLKSEDPGAVDQIARNSIALNEKNQSHLESMLRTQSKIQQNQSPAVDSKSPKISMHTHEMDAKTFYQGLSISSEKNIVLHPDIKGTITINVDNMPLDKVLEIAKSLYGYNYKKEGDYYLVYPATIQTRIFKLNYLNINRYGDSGLEISSGVISKTTPDSQTGQATTAQHSSPKNGVSTKYQNHIWKEIESSLTMMVNKDKGESLAINPNANMIIVKANPMALNDIESYIKSLENHITKQVIIEAKIIEVELNNSSQSGVNWAAFGKSNNNSILMSQNLQGGVNTSGQAFALNDISNATLSTLSAFSADGIASHPFGGLFSLAVNLNNFGAFIEFLETQGTSRVLSSPRISTLNNQKAIIKVGAEEFFVTGFDLKSDSDTNENNIDVNLSPFFSGISLDVTPQINDESEITLHIHPKISEVSEKVKEIGVSSADSLSIPLGFSNTRETDSVVRARSGQVIILGGLMRSISNSSHQGLPGSNNNGWLSSVLGHKGNNHRKSELIILLKPTIVDVSNHQWNKQFQTLIQDESADDR